MAGRAWRRLLFLLCLVAVFSGAAVFAANPPGIWLDVPFVKQPEEGCGAATIAMVMQYWSKQQGREDKSADVAEIQRTLYSKDAHGIYASALKDYLQQHGFKVFDFSGSWDDLKQHIERGRPLIAALKSPGAGAPLHYVVVVGVNWEEQAVLVNDPANRKLLKQDRASFEKQWAAVNNWTLLAVPQPPAH